MWSALVVYARNGTVTPDNALKSYPKAIQTLNLRSLIKISFIKIGLNLSKTLRKKCLYSEFF